MIYEWVYIIEAPFRCPLHGGLLASPPIITIGCKYQPGTKDLAYLAL